MRSIRDLVRAIPPSIRREDARRDWVYSQLTTAERRAAVDAYIIVSIRETDRYDRDREANCEIARQQATRRRENSRDPGAAMRRAVAQVQEFLDPYLLAKEFADSFLGQEFVLADGTHVTWGLATAAQHRSCIRMLERNTDALQKDIDLHQRALSSITGTGARCLADVKRSAMARV